VEIKLYVHSQRVGVAESPAERSIANGPLRVWSKDFDFDIRV
jgi:hypothetical protein